MTGPDTRLIAVTMGDPAGIGLDIILTAWPLRHLRGLPRFVVYGNATVVRDRGQRLGVDTNVCVVGSVQESAACGRDALPLISVGSCGHVTPGQPVAASAPATISAIDQATAAVLTGAARALVTAPISKAVLYGAGFRHPGHTEYLAHLASIHQGGTAIQPVMMLACEELKVVPATIHIPLAAVPGALTRDVIEATITITADALRRDFGLAQPRIAVCGLNPHAGESGTLGREEIEIIAPVIALLAERGLQVSGPFSADTLFHAEARTRYDAVVAMYHDQALIPIKTLAFDRGVNVTLGLPFVRTSPDHGTAFDIAGTGRANPESFIAALKLADRMATQRNRTRPD